MTAIEYISHTEGIVKASWSKFQYDGAAAFIVSQRSSVPPALPAKDLPRGRTQLFNLCPMKSIDRHPAESDEEHATEIISDTENWLNCHGDVDNPTKCEDDWEADNESHIVLDIGIEDLESPEQWDVSSAPNVPGLIWPTQRSLYTADRGLMMVNAMEMRRNKGNKTM